MPRTAEAIELGLLCIALRKRVRESPLMLTSSAG
jgi:hypothetical protein